MIRFLKMLARFAAQPLLRLQYLSVHWRITAAASKEKGRSPGGEKTPSLTIVMLSFNRFSDTKRCLRSIFAHVTIPFSLLIIDNGSRKEVQAKLSALCSGYSNITLRLEERNLGCAGGRNLALDLVNSECVLFVDNDLVLYPGFLRHLVDRLEKEPSAAGVCCRVIYPNGRIQYDGGTLERKGDFAVFGLRDSGKKWNHHSTPRERSCEWIPGGATLWRTRVLLENRIDVRMNGEYEDNELSYRLRRKGYLLLSSPDSMVVHRHFRFKGPMGRRAERAYYAERNDRQRSQAALRNFYRTYGEIMVFGDLEAFCVRHYGTVESSKIAEAMRVPPSTFASPDQPTPSNLSVGKSART